MSTKTRRDLVYRALADLGVIRAGQTPNDEDAAAVDALVEPVVDRLEQMEVAAIADVENIPSAEFLPLAICLAGAAAAEFGGGPDANAVMAAEQQLRIINRAGPTYAVMEGQYY